MWLWSRFDFFLTCRTHDIALYCSTKPKPVLGVWNGSLFYNKWIKSDKMLVLLISFMFHCVEWSKFNVVISPSVLLNLTKTITTFRWNVVICMNLYKSEARSLVSYKILHCISIHFFHCCRIKRSEYYFCLKGNRIWHYLICVHANRKRERWNCGNHAKS